MPALLCILVLLQAESLQDNGKSNGPPLSGNIRIQLFQKSLLGLDREQVVNKLNKITLSVRVDLAGSIEQVSEDSETAGVAGLRRGFCD